MKYCKRCDTNKELTEFRKNGKKHSWCRICQNEYNKQWYYKNRERGLRWRKNSNLKRAFGITIDEYEKLLKSQGGVCKICGNKQNGKHLAVDHNHATNKIRGILCDNCNRGLGMFKDNPILLNQAIKYLKEQDEEAV